MLEEVAPAKNPEATTLAAKQASEAKKPDKQHIDYALGELPRFEVKPDHSSAAPVSFFEMDPKFSNTLAKQRQV